MSPKKTVVGILASLISMIVIAYFYYPHPFRSYLIYNYSKSTPLIHTIYDPKISNEAYSKNVIQINSNVTAQLKYYNVPFLGKSIQYSDESQSRSLNYMDSKTNYGDYLIQEIRLNSGSNILYIRTTGNENDFKNTYICKFDLIKRKCVSRTQISPELLSKIPTP